MAASTKTLNRASQFLADIRRNPVVLRNTTALHIKTFRSCQFNSGIKSFQHQQLPTLRFHNENLQISSEVVRSESGDSLVQLTFKNGSVFEIPSEQGLVDQDILRKVIAADSGASQQ